MLHNLQMGRDTQDTLLLGSEERTVLNQTTRNQKSSERLTQRQQRAEAPKSWIAWTAALFDVGFLVLTSVYASDVTAASHLRFLYSSSSNTIFVLSVLSSLTGLFLSATIGATFEKIQWLLISRKEGLRLSKFLSLQPGTGVMGLLTLILGKSRNETRNWAAVRLVAIILVPILSILIMSALYIPYECVKECGLTAYPR